MIKKVFRHGERSPSGSYSTDPNKNHTWPGGYGALSPVFSFRNLKKKNDFPFFFSL